MRIISLNANGIRAASRKGFFDWLPKQNADAVCIQETKAKINQLDASFFPEGWHAYYCDANKPGYSGVALYTPHQPDTVHWGLGFDEFDAEGRAIDAVTYMADGNPEDGNPSLRYITLLRDGAAAHGLPAAYLDYLNNVEPAS